MHTYGTTIAHLNQSPSDSHPHIFLNGLIAKGETKNAIPDFSPSELAFLTHLSQCLREVVVQGGKIENEALGRR